MSATRFKKMGDVWVLEGPHLVEGSTIAVARRDGSTSEVNVGRVVVPPREGDGMTIAFIEAEPTPPRRRSRRGPAGCTGEPCRCMGMEVWDGECLSDGRGPQEIDREVEHTG